MEKQIGTTEARKKRREILDEVQYRGAKYVINRRSEAAVAVVPIEIYSNWKQRRKRLIELIHTVQSANADADPDEVLLDVVDAQQAVGRSTE